MAECLSCGEPITDTAYVCRREALRLEGRLRETADLWPHVAETVWRQDRMAAPGPRPRGHAPAEPIRPDGGAMRHYADQVTGWPLGLPVNLRASDSRDWTRLAVVTWTQAVAEEIGADMPPTIPEAMRWLAGQLQWVRYRKWAGEAMDALDDACAEVRRIVDRRATRARFAVGLCPEPDGVIWCTGTVWARVPESDQRDATLACDRCGTVWDTLHWAGAGRRILARMREAA